MYTDYYKFSGLPFQLTPDGRFFFGSSVHSRAMGFLNYGIMHGEGYVVITGEVGAGKTTLVERLLGGLNRNKFLVGRIVTTQLDGENLLRMVGSAFNVYKIGLDKASLLVKIRDLLEALQREGKRALLIVDEAQSLHKEALEELRMLSNISVEGGTPIQGILLGQPEFRQIMGSAELEQLRQRVIASCHLSALDADDTQQYVEHRLKHVGWDGSHPYFTNGAFAEIYRFTGGIPRKINVLCSRVLLLGFLDEHTRFTGALVSRVAKEIASEIGPLQEQQALSAEPSGMESASGEALRTLSTRVEAIEKRLEELEKDVETESHHPDAPTSISRFR